MNKKIIAFSIIMMLMIFGITTMSYAKNTNLSFNDNGSYKKLNKEIFLGTASIYGDGIEENTVIELDAEIDLSIGIDSQTEIVDFYVDYTMTCDSLTDNGIVTLFVQINGDNVGLDEAITFTEDVFYLLK